MYIIEYTLIYYWILSLRYGFSHGGGGGGVGPNCQSFKTSKVCIGATRRMEQVMEASRYQCSVVPAACLTRHTLALRYQYFINKQEMPYRMESLMQ